MKRLTATLREQQEEAAKLDAAIAANLKELGMAVEWAGAYAPWRVREASASGMTFRMSSGSRGVSRSLAHSELTGWHDKARATGPGSRSVEVAHPLASRLTRRSDYLASEYSALTLSTSMAMTSALRYYFLTTSSIFKATTRAAPNPRSTETSHSSAISLLISRPSASNAPSPTSLARWMTRSS